MLRGAFRGLWRRAELECRGVHRFRRNTLVGCDWLRRSDSARHVPARRQPTTDRTLQPTEGAYARLGRRTHEPTRRAPQAKVLGLRPGSRADHTGRLERPTPAADATRQAHAPCLQYRVRLDHDLGRSRGRTGLRARTRSVLRFHERRRRRVDVLTESGKTSSARLARSRPRRTQTLPHTGTTKLTIAPLLAPVDPLDKGRKSPGFSDKFVRRLMAFSAPAVNTYTLEDVARSSGITTA